MNERIQKLADESGIGYLSSVNPSMVEKFAEVIVRECALISGIMEHEGRKNIGAQILDNFGIKE